MQLAQDKIHEAALDEVQLEVQLIKQERRTEPTPLTPPLLATAAPRELRGARCRPPLTPLRPTQ